MDRVDEDAFWGPRPGKFALHLTSVLSAGLLGKLRPQPLLISTCKGHQ